MGVSKVACFETAISTTEGVGFIFPRVLLFEFVANADGYLPGSMQSSHGLVLFS